jgi:hypothetical protein
VFLQLTTAKVQAMPGMQLAGTAEATASLQQSSQLCLLAVAGLFARPV